MPLRDATNPSVRRHSRRRLLKHTALALPWLNFSQLLAATPERPVRIGKQKIQSCIVLFFYGGPSHLDTWDPKPDAPAEIRGEFRPIATRVPGLHFGEHLPRCAAVADKLAVIRSMHHTMRNHNSAAVEALCGRTPLKGDAELLADDANSFPCYGAALTKLSPPSGEVPPHIALPQLMYNVVVLPGQTAGFLGPAYNPFQLNSDPNQADFRVAELLLPPEMSPGRLDARQALLADMGDRRGSALLDTSTRAIDDYRRKAFDLLRSPQVRRAFEIEREPAAVRERYGRHTLGQSLLLARRLVEAGVRFINVNDRFRNSQLTNWDSHLDNAARLRDNLLPPADQALPALVEDLDERGLLDSTLVVALGEFGRTPLVNKNAGRDHWPDCFSVVLAGGGVSGGSIYGSSDRNGAYPDLLPVTPGDLAATVFWRFGLDPGFELHDLVGRPQKLAAGAPLEKLFGDS